MRRAAAPLGACCALAVAAACSGLPAVDNGVVALQLDIPEVDTLVIGDTLHLAAQALDAGGNAVAATIIWQTADTLLVSIPDSTRGAVVARSDSGTARVQASLGTLHSDPVSIQLRPDTTSTGSAIRP